MWLKFSLGDRIFPKLINLRGFGDVGIGCLTLFLCMNLSFIFELGYTTKISLYFAIYKFYTSLCGGGGCPITSINLQSFDVN